MKSIIPLTREQILLVEENTSVINTVIFSRIIFNNSKYGFEYDDLFQEGALLLCKAAQQFDNSRNVSFEAYAYVVILNGLLSYCKKMNKNCKALQDYTNILKQTIEMNTAYNLFQVDKFIELDILIFLESFKKQYSGIAVLGIDALIWKVKGLNGSDIAHLYGVKPNLVGAWISRALKKLRENPVFNLYMEEILKEKVS